MSSVSGLIKYPWYLVFEMELSRACTERPRRVHYQTFYTRKHPFSNQLLLLKQASDSEFLQQVTVVEPVVYTDSTESARDHPTEPIGATRRQHAEPLPVRLVNTTLELITLLLE